MPLLLTTTCWCSFWLKTAFVGFLLSLPQDLFSTFVLEAAFGFNKQDWKVFVTDKLKVGALTVVLGAPITCAVIAIVRFTGRMFSVYLWVFVTCVCVVVMVLYPVVFLPLFNKLTPLEDGELKDAVGALAAKNGFDFAQVMVMDGSKRSGHSNAFFTGFGKQRRIVLFDTLIEQLSTQEICAVLAHELGHWKNRHVLKMFALSSAHNLLTFALLGQFIHDDKLYADFGFDMSNGQHPVVIGMSLFFMVFGPIDSLFSFVLNCLMRRFEYQADAFATRQGYDLATALAKITKENSSTLLIDPLYSAYHFNHPTLLERLAAIDNIKLSMEGKEQQQAATTEDDSKPKQE